VYIHAARADGSPSASADGRCDTLKIMDSKKHALETNQLCRRPRSVKNAEGLVDYNGIRIIEFATHRGPQRPLGTGFTVQGSFLLGS